MSNRRKFIKNTTLGFIGLSIVPKLTLSNEINTKITILHTNDTHSHIHPFTSGRNKGLGVWPKEQD